MRALLILTFFTQMALAQSSGYGIDDESYSSPIRDSLCKDAKKTAPAEIIKKCNSKPAIADKLDCFQMQSVCDGQGRKCNGLTGDSGVQCYFDVFNAEQRTRAADAGSTSGDASAGK